TVVWRLSVLLRSELLSWHNSTFFFQAEDGIRDSSVTGVQTCALPICWIFPRDPQFAAKAGRILDLYQRLWKGRKLSANEFVVSRSEERRVGKECRVGALAKRSNEKTQLAI